MDPGAVHIFQIQVVASQSERSMTFFLRKPTIALFLDRLSPPSEAGAEETRSPSITRWQPTSASDEKGPRRHFWLMLESALQLVGVP